MTKPVIGLTGPTGAGKSTVAAAFQKQRCIIVDADQIARTIVETPHCFSRLKETFGEGILHPDGSLDRRALADLAFSSPENTAKLNRITHPAIYAESQKQIQKAAASDCRAVILDAPLLFECSAQKFCDRTIAILTPDSSRLKRIMARDGITEAEAKERMASQHTNEYYQKQADYSFDGSMDRSILGKAAGMLLDHILRDCHEKP